MYLDPHDGEIIARPVKHSRPPPVDLGQLLLSGAMGPVGQTRGHCHRPIYASKHPAPSCIADPRPTTTTQFLSCPVCPPQRNFTLRFHRNSKVDINELEEYIKLQRLVIWMGRRAQSQISSGLLVIFSVFQVRLYPQLKLSMSCHK